MGCRRPAVLIALVLCGSSACVLYKGAEAQPAVVMMKQVSKQLAKNAKTGLNSYCHFILIVENMRLTP
jgi:hypothetical protein